MMNSPIWEKVLIFESGAKSILLQGNFNNIKSKRIIHLIECPPFPSWPVRALEIYEDSTAVKLEWLWPEDSRMMDYKITNKRELKILPSIEFYTFKMSEGLKNNIDNNINFINFNKPIRYKPGIDGTAYYLYILKNDEVYEFSWCSEVPNEFSYITELSNCLIEKLNEDVPDTYEYDYFGIEGRLWFESSSVQMTPELIKYIINYCSSYQFDHKEIYTRLIAGKKTLLSRSLDYNDFIEIKEEAAKLGIILAYEDLRK